MMGQITKRIRDLDFVYSNELIFKDGKLDGVTINVDSDKSKSARIKIAEWGEEERRHIVCVVDGANDIKLFDICGLGIAYRAQDVVKDLATTTLWKKKISLKLLDIINKHYKLTISICNSYSINNFLVLLLDRHYLQIIPIHVKKEIEPSDDISDIILKSEKLNDGDILVIAQKIVSKQEGRLIDLSTVTHFFVG